MNLKKIKGGYIYKNEKWLILSFIVSSIDAPKSCYECVLEFTFFKHCNCGKLEGITEKDKNGLIYTKSRHPNCPLKEIKD